MAKRAVKYDKGKKGKGKGKKKGGPKRTGKRRGRKKGFKHSKATRAKIARAVRAAWRARRGGGSRKKRARKAARGSKKRARKAARGSKKRARKAARGSKKRARKSPKKAQKSHQKPDRCAICGNPIFGGPKGMATHTRKRHPGARPTAVQKAVARHARKKARRVRRAPVAVAPATGFAPELRARLLARKAAMQAAGTWHKAA